MAAESDEPPAGDAKTNVASAGGQDAVARPARQQLLFELDMQKQAQELRQEIKHEYFAGDAYTPSTKTLDDLKPILISELQPEIHHRDRILFVRVLDDGCRIFAVQTVVEDEAGTADRLAFFNADAALKAEQILPEDALLAVKEPFYTLSADCGPCIRVDHPSDLVHLTAHDALVPAALRDAVLGPEKRDEPQSAQSWKAVGNAAYSSGDYRAAARAYERALNLCTETDRTLKQDVLRNRAIVNLYLKRYEMALKDANEAIIPELDGESSKTLNAKAIYRAGRAAYALGLYDEAGAYFRSVMDLTPADKDAANELQKVHARQKEQTSGDYDFATMSRRCSEKHNRLDHADFYRDTKVQEVAGHGRGLIASKDFEPGDLILCEKAFCTAFSSDREAAEKYTILHRATQRQSAGTQAILIYNLTQKLMYNPELAQKFFDLSGGGYPNETPLKVSDGRVPVDVFRVNAIVEHNSFACPTVRSSSKAAQKQSSDQRSYHSTGLWLRASYINHACDGNSMRSFIGDMIIIRAAKKISNGEEILMPYMLPNPKNDILQAELQKAFSFTCDCRVCAAEAASSETQRKERAEIIDKIMAVMFSQPLPLRQQPDRRIFTQVERLMVRLESTYDPQAFGSGPRFALVPPGIWLCQVYALAPSGATEKIVKMAIATLQNLGFVVDIAGTDVSIDWQNASIQGAAIQAAMFAARAYQKKGKGNARVAEKMEKFAKDLYFIMHGELREFEGNY